MVTDTPPSYRKSIAEDEKSFVNMRACQQHASLLHTFFQLRSNNAETEKAYLVRAELRYLLWIQLVAKEKPDANILPPIDVVYMWHAHLLSPFRYYEDLAKSQYQNGVDPESEAFWHRAYPKEPYLLTPENLNSGQAIITCPYCLSTLASEWSQYVKMRTDKTKSIECDGCGKNVNVQVLSSARFMKDLAECTTDSVKVAGWHLDRGGEYHEVNKNLATRVVELASRLDAKNWRTSGRRFNWQEIFGTMKSKNVRTPTTMSVFRIMGKVAQSHYAGIPFSTSLDLIFAVSRQWDFTEKMVDINWNSPEALADAVTRYRKFLMLMKDHPSQIMVPILSIDLAWHTHMLNHAAYREYTLLHLKKVINHDDTITSTLINCNLITTAKLWYAKYREPYTTEDLGKLYKKENKAGFLFPPTTLYYMLQKKNLSKAWQEQSLAQNGEKRKPQRQDIVNHDSSKCMMTFG
ncbi:hypothetical protein NQZ79_g7931 [Umbelopsis isabellina]|nr:hypothetical protein NQZ79_g7931 [Umbelopsis isabellina]